MFLPINKLAGKRKFHGFILAKNKEHICNDARKTQFPVKSSSLRSIHLHLKGNSQPSSNIIGRFSGPKEISRIVLENK